MQRKKKSLGAIASGVAAGLISSGLTAAYSMTVGRNDFLIQQETLPLLPSGNDPIRILHLSDMHMTPDRTELQDFVAQLADLEPDLVINTGDNLAHPKAVPAVTRSLSRLLQIPGFFVFGSNDYFAPDFKNPLSYFAGPSTLRDRDPLPWQGMRAVFQEHGWRDATHQRHYVEIKGTRILVAGVDDPHIDRDRYNTIADARTPDTDLALGLVHAPEPRVLRRFDDDNYNMVFAGHTHGGQVCLPNGQALVTNCGIDRKRAHGLHRWGKLWLNVTAGLGTSPYAPFRLFCKPEVTLLTLTD
ncbi:MAG: metallophosphoesterase [Lawsonella sp.]